jgi:hypothetical protein
MRAASWRVLRAQKIDLDKRKSWCESDDPQFLAKAADVVGLYMAPPRERHRHLRRRETLDPGAGAGAGSSEASQRPGAFRLQPRLESRRRASEFDVLHVHIDLLQRRG